MGDYSIGVDLGGTNLRIAAVDSGGKLLEKLTLGAEVSRGRDFVINEMCKAIETLRTKYHDTGELAGIGIGVPGFIDMAAGMVMESPNLPDWTSFPVRDVIEKRLGAKVILENDANSAAMGEKWLGAAREYAHMAMYTLGTGVGGGLVFNGRLWHGMTGMAGGDHVHFAMQLDGVQIDPKEWWDPHWIQDHIARRVDLSGFSATAAGTAPASGAKPQHKGAAHHRRH